MCLSQDSQLVLNEERIECDVAGLVICFDIAQTSVSDHDRQVCNTYPGTGYTCSGMVQKMYPKDRVLKVFET